MKKLLSLPVLAVCCMMMTASCKKNDSSNPSGPGNNNPYYFNFKLNGTAYNFSSPLPQYISSDAQLAGGYQESSTAFVPSIGLQFVFGHIVTDSDMTGLAGKTLYFNGTGPGINLDFDDAAGNTQYSVDTSNTAYNVKISSVTYVGIDSTIFNKVAVYAIKGTCSAVLENGASNPMSVLTDGSFNFLVSRVK
ncbi:hypothetical protein ACTHGU_03105 [Chitinophagaceae bacterium MMS25-I14]